MKPKWIVTKYGHDDFLNKIGYALQDAGLEVEIMPLKEVYEEIIYKPNKQSGCVVFLGPTCTTVAIARARPNWVTGTYHNPETYKCSNYYSMAGEFLTQKSYAFYPLGEVYRLMETLYQNFGINDELFIRPDYGEKIFTGAVVKKELFHCFMAMNELDHVPHNTLCVVSQPQTIDREYRLVIHRGKVIAGSMYREKGHIEYANIDGSEDRARLVEMAEVIALKLEEFPPVYVMDLAPSGKETTLMEVGCVNCAGFYEAKLEPIIRAVSEEAETEYNEIYE